MCCKSFWKKIVSFVIAFLFGLLIVGISQIVDSFNKAQELLNKRNEAIKIQEKTIYTEQGSGRSGYGYGIDSPENKNIKLEKPLDPNNPNLTIFFKPRPLYTAQARANNTQGAVILRIAFLANGQIGNIEPISELPDGLTEQAISAAKQMKFEPATKNGRPTTVIKSVQFNFTIY